MQPEFDAAREAERLTDQQRRFLLATPRQQPADAGIIAHRAGDMRGGHTFAGFARRQAWLFQRSRNCYNTALTYRLSKDGMAVADAVRPIDHARKEEG